MGTVVKKPDEVVTKNWHSVNPPFIYRGVGSFEKS